MNQLLIINIKELTGITSPGVSRLPGLTAGTQFNCLHDAFLKTDAEGKIAEFGPMSALAAAEYEGCEIIDAAGGIVMPAFCDSHTHIIYAGHREGEFCDKIRGMSYAEIAERGGGILNSADLLNKVSEDELYRQSLERLRLTLSMGTASIEIKSGYGLTLESELKMLRVAARLRDESPGNVKITFLGAHAVGRAFAGRQEQYVRHVIDDMLPAVAAQGLADYVDVFCDTGFFTPYQTAHILEAAAQLGFKAKIHANELGVSGGVQTAVAAGALSADHLESVTAEELQLLAQSQTVATMLPGASFFSRLPYAPALKAMEAGATVALASDYNPGSSPSGDMRFIWALACIQMRLMPQQALAALTLNGAAAMELSQSTGSICKGKDADLIVTRPVPSLAFIPYAYTTPYISRIVVKGRILS